jgi:hypothetical protein
MSCEPLDFFFVCSASNPSKSEKQITDQIQVMNQDFAGTGLQFRLVSIGRWRQATWFGQAGPDASSIQAAMKKSLRKGTRADLNIYTVGFTSAQHNVSFFFFFSIIRPASSLRLYRDCWGTRLFHLIIPVNLWTMVLYSFFPLCLAVRALR